MAIQQSMVDGQNAKGPEPGGSSGSDQATDRWRLDSFAAFGLHAIRRCIAFADLPAAKSVPLFAAIDRKAKAQYPWTNGLARPEFNHSSQAFQRDQNLHSRNVLLASIAVYLYRADHGSFPASISAAMSTILVDAFNGSRLNYQSSPNGFAIFTDHELPDRDPQPVGFRYSLWRVAAMAPICATFRTVGCQTRSQSYRRKVSRMPYFRTMLGAAAILAATSVCARVAAPEPTLAQERTAAKSAGLELDARVLSRPMPPESENAAPLYKKFDELDRRRPKDALGPTILDKERGHASTLTSEEWVQVEKVLVGRTAEIEVIRQAARRPQCVFGPHEYVPPSTSDEALGDPYLRGGPLLREATRLIVCEGIWEAHARRLEDALSDLSLGFAMAKQAQSHDTVIGFLNGGGIIGVTAGGFRQVLHLDGADRAACKAVAATLVAKLREPSLSSALRHEVAFQQGFLDRYLTDPSGSVFNLNRLSVAEYRQKLDAYGAFELRQMRKSIAIADDPYANCAPVMLAIGAEGEQRYPEKGELTNFAGDFSGAAFQRDTWANSVRVTLAAASVLGYHATTGAFPATLAAAISNPPADAFDGESLHYEATPTGFVISATHERLGQKVGQKPVAITFRYP